MKLKQFNFKKVKSTNQTAIRIIRKTKNEFGLIVSQSQSSGKGQYGRKWISYKGNIFLSFFYKLKKINLSMNSLTKKNCFLVKDVISKYYKKKICGILQEKIKNSTNEYLVVGIGLNLFKSPNIIGYPTTNLFEITNKKINKKLFEKQLKITFEKFLSKYYKTN